MKPANSSTYFAADTDIARRLWQKIEQFYDWAQSSNWLSQMRASYAYANGLTNDGTGAVAWDIVRGGDQGELLQSVENHYASIGESLVTITTAQRPAVQCGSANSDYRSIAQTLIASGVIEYYLTERKLESLLKRATKSGTFLGEGFIYLPWDALAGDDFGPDMSAVEAAVQQGMDLEEALHSAPTQKTGDIRFLHLSPMDVVRDPYAESWEACQWLVVREWVNKFDLAAQFPEHEDRIKTLTPEEKTKRRISYTRKDEDATELIPLWTFFHLDTRALPGGRCVKFLSDDLVLTDGPMPYDELPVYRLCPDEFEGTPFGKTRMFDLLGPQKAVNGLDSSIVGNQLGRGLGNLTARRGANVSVEALSSSMNLVEYDGQEAPQPLAWPSTPKEFFEYKDAKIRSMETLSGVGSVVRGDPSQAVGSDASGAKLAFLQAQAIQSNDGLQKSYSNLVRDVAMGIIRRFKSFGGDVPRVVRLAGKTNRYLAKEFTAKDLADIDRVTVDVGNPLMRTVSGKMAIADKLVEMRVIKTADQYLMLVKAGTYEPLVEGEQSVQMRIRAENERLMEGGAHTPLVSDPHWIEIAQHLSVLDNPEAREAPGVAEAVTKAVQEHLNLFLGMTPAMVALRGGPEALALWQQVQQMMGAPPGALPPGAPPEAGPPPPGGPSAGPPPESLQGAPSALSAQMPRMPTNPATGEEASVPGVTDQMGVA